MKTIVVIPARYGATRLPGKPLAEIHGKPMIQWVWERARQVRGIERVIVATDDQRIFDAVSRFGGEARMTPPECASGTDRVAAVAETSPADVYVNVQGDEPFIEPETIEAAVKMVTERGFSMGSAMTRLLNVGELENRAVVKAIADLNGRALYFSRFPIPYSREAAPSENFACHRHLGLYAYTKETLFRLRQLPPSGAERAESLEQLRALQNGISIGLALVDSRAFGIDTPDDLEKARQCLKP